MTSLSKSQLFLSGHGANICFVVWAGLAVKGEWGTSGGGPLLEAEREPCSTKRQIALLQSTAVSFWDEFSLNQIFIPAWGLHLENYVLIVWASCINKKRQRRCQLETISQSPSVYTRKMRCIILPWGQGIYAWIYVCWYLLVSLVTRHAQGNVLLSQEPGTQCGCSNKMTIIVGLIVEPSLA